MSTLTLPGVSTYLIAGFDGTITLTLLPPVSVGGANVTDSSNAVGSDNSEFVLRYLEAEGLRCAAQDLGGTLPRRINYYPATGRVVRRLLGMNERGMVHREEHDYGKRLQKQSPAGEIELFGDN